MAFIIKHKKKALYLCKHKNQLVFDLQQATVYYSETSAKTLLLSRTFNLRLLKDYGFKYTQFEVQPITILLNETYTKSKTG